MRIESIAAVEARAIESAGLLRLSTIDVRFPSCTVPFTAAVSKGIRTGLLSVRG